MCDAVQVVPGQSGQVAFVDAGYSGPDAQKAAGQYDVRLEVVKSPAATKGFVLLPKRWVAERSLAWVMCFRRLDKDYERLPETVKSLYILAFVCLMLNNLLR